MEYAFLLNLLQVISIQIQFKAQMQLQLVFSQELIIDQVLLPSVLVPDLILKAQMQLVLDFKQVQQVKHKIPSQLEHKQETLFKLLYR